MRVALVLALGALACRGQATFNDSAQDRLVLGAKGYQIAFGSRFGCLWGVEFDYRGPNANFQCGARFSPQGAARFSYQFDAPSSTLTLTYADNPAAATRVNAVVTVTASQPSYFDQWSSAAGQVLLPYELVHDTNAVQSGYLPF